MKVGVLHTAFLGDLCLAGLLVEALYRCGHDISIFSKRPGVALYGSDPRVARTVLVDKGRGIAKVGGVFRLAEQIRALELDALLVPHRSLTSALAACIARVPIRVGFDSSALPQAFTHRVPWCSDRHESVRYLNLAIEPLVDNETSLKLSQLSRPVLVPPVRSPEFFLAHPELISTGSSFFIVAPGSNWATKKYPAQALARVVEQLLARAPHLYCVVNGGPGDESDVAEFLSACGAIRSRVRDATGKVPIGDLAAVTQRAAFLIVNDSAPLHFAAGLDRPVVAIFGPTSWTSGLGPSSTRRVVVHFEDELGNRLSCQPCSPHGMKTCPLGHHRCMRDLAPARVVQATVKLLPEIFGQDERCSNVASEVK